MGLGRERVSVVEMRGRQGRFRNRGGEVWRWAEGEERREKGGVQW